MSIQPTPRVALITGANRGIGFETAKQFVKRGFHVVITARDDNRGVEAADKLQAGAGKATFLLLDVANSESIREAANRFRSIADRLDVLINNAGIYPNDKVSILTIPRGQMVETVQTNTFGPLEVTQAFLPYLRRAAA